MIHSLRTAVLAGLIILAFVLLYAWQQRTEEHAIANPSPVDNPTPVQVESETRKKALEYVAIFILPGLDKPGFAKVPIEDVKIEKAAATGNIERWEASGVLEHQAADGSPIKSRWQITIAFADRNFSPVRVVLDGAEIPIPGNAAARAIREAESKE